MYINALSAFTTVWSIGSPGSVLTQLWTAHVSAKNWLNPLEEQAVLLIAEIQPLFVFRQESHLASFRNSLCRPSLALNSEVCLSLPSKCTLHHTPTLPAFKIQCFIYPKPKQLEFKKEQGSSILSSEVHLRVIPRGPILSWDAWAGAWYYVKIHRSDSTFEKIFKIMCACRCVSAPEHTCFRRSEASDPLDLVARVPGTKAEPLSSPASSKGHWSSHLEGLFSFPCPASAYNLNTSLFSHT